MMGKYATYREKKYICGDYMDMYAYPVYPTGRPSGRGRKRRPTRAVQKKLNQRHAAEKLTRILNANFTEKDLSVTLTWRENPEREEDAVKDIQRYLRKIRYRYKKAGKELKYVWQIEKSGKGRYHVHAVLSGGMDRDDLEKLWGKGYANSKRLQFDKCGLAPLAEYVTKSHSRPEEERITYRSYNGSKNLIDPPPEISDSRIRSKKRAVRMAEGEAEIWTELYPGYEIVDMRPFFSEEYGGVYLFARLWRAAGEDAEGGGRQRTRKRH